METRLRVNDVETQELCCNSGIPDDEVCDNNSACDASTNNSENYSLYLKQLKSKNVNRLIFAHININSIRNKFEMLVDGISGNVDVLLISETKLDKSFPPAQFIIKGYSDPYRLDRNNKGGGLLLYIREDIPSKLLKINLVSEEECMFVELNLRQRKWLFICSYNPNKRNTKAHLSFLSKNIDSLSAKYSHFLLMGDLNCEMTDYQLEEFCANYCLKNLITQSTCYKNLNNPSCIDVMITNHNKCFKNSVTLETGLSDFHKMTVPMMKLYFPKQRPKVIEYRNFKNFSNADFQRDLLKMINTDDCNLSKFLDASLQTLNRTDMLLIKKYIFVPTKNPL